jgi:ribosomal protein L37AE/L43A
MTIETRLRKVCPTCSSLNVGKTKKHGAYRCKSCKAIFTVPAMREMKTNNNIPESLQRILTNKQKEALGCDKP